jgi:hypothetical protein
LFAVLLTRRANRQVVCFAGEPAPVTCHRAPREARAALVPGALETCCLGPGEEAGPSGRAQAAILEQSRCLERELEREVRPAPRSAPRAPGSG